MDRNFVNELNTTFPEISDVLSKNYNELMKQTKENKIILINMLKNIRNVINHLVKIYLIKMIVFLKLKNQ